MTATRQGGTVRIKLTISREEHPAMFEALAGIGNPRHRTGRLKELVVKALALEQAGTAVVHRHPRDDGGKQGVAAGAAADSAGAPGTSVASMLDWDPSQT